MSQDVARYLFNKYLKTKDLDVRDDYLEDLIADAEIGSLIWAVVEDYQEFGGQTRVEHLISVIELKFQRLQEEITDKTAFKQGWKRGLDMAIERCPGECKGGCLRIIRALAEEKINGG